MVDEHIELVVEGETVIDSHDISPDKQWRYRTGFYYL
jgi:hypothetical protein